MSVEFIWQLPTSGDGRYGNAQKTRRGERDSATHPYSEGVTDPRGQSFNYFDYLHQIARAADLVGFDGLLIPQNSDGDEPWIVAGYIARGTRHLKLITQFEASWGSSVYAAKNAVSFQRYTNGRVAWQISSGGNLKERRALGDFVPDEDILPRIEEFLTVSKGVTTQVPFTFKGRFFEVLNGGFQGALGNQPVPQVYLSGSTNEAYRLSAKHADVHIFDAGIATDIKRQIDEFRAIAIHQQRSIGLSLRIDVIARETEKEAVFDARRFWEQSGKRTIGENPQVIDHLWDGLSTSITGARATLVGSYEQVAQALITYAKAGIDSFQLSAVPHLEEAYRLGEHVLPIVRAQIHPQHRRAA